MDRAEAGEQAPGPLTGLTTVATTASCSWRTETLEPSGATRCPSPTAVPAASERAAARATSRAASSAAQLRETDTDQPRHRHGEHDDHGQDDGRLGGDRTALTSSSRR